MRLSTCVPGEDVNVQYPYQTAAMLVRWIRLHQYVRRRDRLHVGGHSAFISTAQLFSLATRKLGLT